MKVKEESEKVSLKLSIQKTKIIVGKHWKQQQTIFGGLEITAGDGCLHELKTYL